MHPICIIPARGNSKRLPRKNLSPLNGKPLIAHTIEAAKESGMFASVYVSSEDKTILNVAAEYGAIPLVRPQALSEDHVTIAEACLHSVTQLVQEGMEFEIFAMMQPTSPLRTAQDVRMAYDYLKNSDADAILSVLPCPPSSGHTFVVADGYLQSAKKTDKEGLYKCNGAIDIAKTAAFLREKTFFMQRAIPYVMSSERGIDIDELPHLERAEELLTQSA